MIPADFLSVFANVRLKIDKLPESNEEYAKDVLQELQALCRFLSSAERKQIFFSLVDKGYNIYDLRFLFNTATFYYLTKDLRTPIKQNRQESRNRALSLLRTTNSEKVSEITGIPPSTLRSWKFRERHRRSLQY